MRTFEYEGHLVSIIPGEDKGKRVYWFCVNQKPITFVSQETTAIRLATRFIDTLIAPEFAKSRQSPN